ncbi:MAG: bifunctional nuclease family protein [Puniceicoccales bacterium]|jgi:bifunctional DNase/RNase|nr:bifunctional nuclease family protein [Puniceicoccales bacterium]
MDTVKVGLLAIVPSVNVTTLLIGNDETVFDIHISPPSGRAIIDAIGREKLTRPSTHTLLSNVATILGYQISSIIIHSTKDSIFFAKLKMTSIVNEDRHMELDCRPSDAIALSIINDAPLLVAKELFNLVGKPKSNTLLQKI